MGRLLKGTSIYQNILSIYYQAKTFHQSTLLMYFLLLNIICTHSLGTQYAAVEYLEAILITGGVAVFSMSSQNAKKSADNSDGSLEIAGFMLLSSYVLSDSFTSQWQSRIYRDYGKIDHYHMMYGVNCSSIVFTVLALVISGNRDNDDIIDV